MAVMHVGGVFVFMRKTKGTKGERVQKINTTARWKEEKAKAFLFIIHTQPHGCCD